jgi:hypothetical protein
MYIVNPEKINNKIECNKLVAKYFLERNLPLLSRKGNTYYFANTDLFKEILSLSPFWVKLAIKFDGIK